jgi:hypothetical protein
MTRLATLVFGFAIILVTGCSTKPSADDCRKAIANMQRLMGTDNMRDDGRIEGEVRRCKGGSTKKAVECAVKAQTLDDLRHCEFFKVPETAKGLGSDPTGSTAPGSAAGSAMGSAAGSAATGSAATGSAAGSAATGTGSASGSAATGSATTPSGAAGSAATAPGGVGSAK